jgi:rubrerythrin
LVTKETSMKTQETVKNLEAAFAGESMANRKYLYFAKVAREKGAEEVARLFEEVAHQETYHAFGHLELLFPADKMSVADLLRTAMEGELYETNRMYPEFERTARREKHESATAEFQEQALESATHARLFQDALAKAERRFMGLAKVEGMHAAQYARALEQVERGEKVVVRPERKLDRARGA